MAPPNASKDSWQPGEVINSPDGAFEDSTGQRVRTASLADSGHVSANAFLSGIPCELTDQILHILTQDASLSSSYAGMLGSITSTLFRNIFKDHIQLYSNNLYKVSQDKVERRISKVILRNAQRFASEIVELHDEKTTLQPKPGAQDEQERIVMIDKILSKLPTDEDDVKITYDRLEEFLIGGEPFRKLQERFRNSRDLLAPGAQREANPPPTGHEQKEDVRSIKETADPDQPVEMPTLSPHRPDIPLSGPQESQDLELQDVDITGLHSNETPFPEKVAFSSDILEMDLESQEAIGKSSGSLPAVSQSLRRLRRVLRQLHSIKSEAPIGDGMVRLRWQSVSLACQI